MFSFDFVDVILLTEGIDNIMRYSVLKESQSAVVLNLRKKAKSCFCAKMSRFHSILLRFEQVSLLCFQSCGSQLFRKYDR